MSTMENIAVVVQEMKGKLDEARNTQGEQMKSNSALVTLQAGQSAAFGEGSSKKGPKLRKQTSFNGKGYQK